MKPDTDKRIRLVPRHDTIRVSNDGHMLARTQAAIELLERGYPGRVYIPRQDVAVDILRESAKRTHCPFKGDATYYDLHVAGETLSDAAWSYRDPLPEMAAIADHLCFDHERLILTIDNHQESAP